MSLAVAVVVAVAGCQAPPPGSTAVQLSQRTGGAFEVAMAPFRDGAAVAWHDTRYGNAELYLRLIDARGRPVGAEYRLTMDQEDAFEVSIAAVGDALAVAWYGKRRNESLHAYLGVWDPDEGWRWRVSLADDGASRNPVVGVLNDSIFCAWIEAGETAEGGEFVRYGVWNDAGTRASEPELLGPAGPETWNLNAALDVDGTAFVVFDSPDNIGTYEIFLARVEDKRTVLAQISASDGFASKYPDIALAGAAFDRRAALTWFDEKDGNQEIYLAVSPVTGLTDPDTLADSQRISHSDGPSIGSYLAWNDGSIGIAWSDTLAESYDILFQAFDHDGIAHGDLVTVMNSDADSFVPAILPWDDGFAVAWNEIPTESVNLQEEPGSRIFFARVAAGELP